MLGTKVFDAVVAMVGPAMLNNALLAALGYQAAVKLLTFYKFFLRPGKNLKKCGSWAVVTGATDGIGKAYAFELAKQGLNVFLLSRTEAKLVEVEAELKAAFPSLSFAHLAIDFSNFDTVARSKVAAALKTLDVGVLINNVGMSYNFARYFAELSDADAAALVELNVASTMWMTKIVLGETDTEGKATSGMLLRKRGAIVNTSSGAGRGTTPMLAAYSGAKSWIELFSRGLDAEVRPKGISVQCQAPLYVTTKLAKLRHTSLFVASPKAYARRACACIGYEASISPWWSHALQLWAQSLLPEAVGIAVINMMHAPIRKAGMKKEKRLRDEAKSN